MCKFKGALNALNGLDNLLENDTLHKYLVKYSIHRYHSPISKLSLEYRILERSAGGFFCQGKIYCPDISSSFYDYDILTHTNSSGF